jgi:hypothetical protein
VRGEKLEVREVGSYRLEVRGESLEVGGERWEAGGEKLVGAEKCIKGIFYLFEENAPMYELCYSLISENMLI